MAIDYRTLLNILQARAERLGFVDPDSQRADAAELQIYMFQALMALIELYDLDPYTVNNPQLAQTESGVTNYALPSDFGRLISPREQMKRGMFLFNGAKNVDLTYLDPNSFARKTSPSPQTPESFTVTRRRLWLYPTPDRAYTIRGLYIERPTKPDLGDDVLLEYPTALVNETLFIFATDTGKLTQALAGMRNESLARLVGSEMGEATRIAPKLVASGMGG